MLVTLTSSNSGEIIMFSDVAHRLLEIAGKECTSRGVFTSGQIPDALQKLRQAVLAEKADTTMNNPETGITGEEESQCLPDISLTQRAYPLINLLESTGKANGFITWQAVTDF